MPARFQLAENVSPKVTPDQISASTPNNDVWFEYTLTNVGDEDGAPVNFYITVDDAQTHEILHSEFTYLESTMAPGEENPSSCKIDPDALFGLISGDYWVTLRDASGETLAAALLTVTP